jgi:hypothetical protein
VYLDELRHPPPPAGTLSWADIFAAEPLTGQHWAGAYGLPPGARADADADDDSSDASSGAFALERDLELDLTPPDSDFDTASSADEAAPLPDVTARVHEAYAHRKAVEALERRQYWRADVKSAQAARAFDLGDPSTLGQFSLRLRCAPLRRDDSGQAARRALAKPGALQVAGPQHEVVRYGGVQSVS